MWIVCAGGKRSGSTLQYNIISRIVEESQKGKRIAHFKPDEFLKVKEENKNFMGYKVVKSHTLTYDIKNEINNNNAIVFHCYRDIRDVVVSYFHKGLIKIENDEIIACVKNYINEFEDWMILEKKMRSRKYENFAFNIIKEIEYVLKVLKIELSVQKIKLISEELKIESLRKTQNIISEDKNKNSLEQMFDQDTLLHKNHIYDGSQNQFLKILSKSQISLIESLAYDYLLNNKYKLYWMEFDEFISFSQHADDYIAWQLLGRINKGLVIEVGAFDGRHLSNSYSLNQIGWKSVCIEPNPDVFKYLLLNRPNSININKAIVGYEGIKDIDFFSEETGVLSGCDYNDLDIKKRYEDRGLEYKEPRKIKVEATTLNSIFNELKIAKIDLLSIDVEGFELEVLKGIDINNLVIKLFVIEANSLKEKLKILDYFKNYQAYIHIGDNGQNMFIMNTEYLSKSILRQLDYHKYIKAKQLHPIGERLAIDSTAPKFVKTKDILKYEKYFGIF
jgi:FkbM family methyltransferase